jgi:hypothetical protein
LQHGVEPVACLTYTRWLKKVQCKPFACLRTLCLGMAGVHVHRMLLGLTAHGADVGPWSQLLGACRAALDAEGGVTAAA